jgi:hypothetical protein
MEIGLHVFMELWLSIEKCVVTVPSNEWYITKKHVGMYNLLYIFFRRNEKCQYHYD